MSKDVREAVSRFWDSYQPREEEPSADELAQIAEDSRQRAPSAPPEPACVEWWSALSLVVQQKWLAEPKTPTMREAWRESAKRLEAVNYARASVGLEGFKLSDADEQKAAQFVAGEINLAEFVAPRPR